MNWVVGASWLYVDAHMRQTVHQYTGRVVTIESTCAVARRRHSASCNNDVFAPWPVHRRSVVVARGQAMRRGKQAMRPDIYCAPWHIDML